MKLTFCDIANLIECMAMFDFIKGLSVFSIVIEPYSDLLPLLGGFSLKCS